MPKPPKRPRDMAQLAKLIGDMATGQAPPDPVPTPAQERAAKGGKARAAKLSPAKRKAIAKKAGTAPRKKR